MPSRRDSVGGGVVAEFFRGLRKPSRFSGGGGSSSIFSWSPKAVAIQWGGGSSRIFSWSQEGVAVQWGGGVVVAFFRGLRKASRFSGGGGGGWYQDFSADGPFCIFRLSKRGPPGSPLNRPLLHTYIHTYIHTFIRPYIHTNIHACIRTYMHACLHACIHTYIHAYIHTNNRGLLILITVHLDTRLWSKTSFGSVNRLQMHTIQWLDRGIVWSFHGCTGK